MTIFASKSPADLIRTPEDDALIASGDFCVEEVYGLIPSKLHNAPNPILLAHREYRDRVAAGGGDPVREHLNEIEYTLRNQEGVYGDNYGNIYTFEEMYHAQAVLERLARLRDITTPSPEEG